MPRLAKDPHLALVIPALNEAKNILPVFEEIAAISHDFPSFEILVVDDGSQDGTFERLKKVRDLYALPVRLFKHPYPLGKSASLYTAISHARAPWIATMDADGQDNPAFIPLLLKHAEDLASNGENVLVVGIRRKRCDIVSKRLATKFANALRSFLLKDGCPDTAAPMKVFSAEFFLSLPQFEGVHRFLPAFLKMQKGRLGMVDVVHRRRLYGKSKYTNYMRAFTGFFDLLAVYWLSKRYRNHGGFLED